MKNRTRPTVTVAAVDVRCPGCGEFVAEPSSGAQFFTVAEYKPGAVLICDCCHATIVLPALKTVRWE
jgi:ribosomal protein S27E